MNPQHHTAFSLARYYGGKNKSDILTKVVLVLLVLLILWTPLTFGSVQSESIFWIEAGGAICCLFWIIKLVFLGNPEELERFRDLWERRNRARKAAPFFYRHPRAARSLSLLTFGKWPNKNPSYSVEVIGLEPLDLSLPYHSFLGYPVRDTGLEWAALMFLAMLVLQIIPLPKLLTWMISPNARDLYESAASAAAVPLTFHPVSLNPFFTVSRLFQYTAYFMIYLATVNLIRTRAAYRTVVYAIIVSAFFQTSYGLYEFFSGQQQIFEYQKTIFLDCASGTFINRNHFCAYLGLALPLILALLFSSGGFRKPTTGDWPVRVSRMMENQGGKIIFRFLLAGCVFAGAVFSFSLTGIVAIILGCAAFLLLHQKIRRRSILLLLCAFVIAGGVAVYFGSAFLQHRLGGIELISDRSRFMAWKDTARIFLKFPITGTGSGTFVEIFPVYRSFTTSATFSHAHNEPLEFLAENGIAMFFFMLICLQALASQLLTTLKKEDFTGMHLFQIAAFCSFLVLLLHNSVDFSFEIPAIALTGAIILALFYADYHEKSETAQL